MNPLYTLVAHTVIVVALVIVGAVTHDHSLIDAGLAYGAGAGVQSQASSAVQTADGK